MFILPDNFDKAVMGLHLIESDVEKALERPVSDAARPDAIRELYAQQRDDAKSTRYGRRRSHTRDNRQHAAPEAFASVWCRLLVEEAWHTA